MLQSRRSFVAAGMAAASSSAALLPIPASAQQLEPLSRDEIGSLFDGLPGRTAFKVWAPAMAGGAEFLAELNAPARLFVASAIKTFILCEALRQADSPDVVTTISNRQLLLDSSVWMLDSATFNPPNLRGLVSERTTLEAMILHSDNTATDMSLRLVGPDNVRRFIASAGLKQTMIPDSTRIAFAYIVGLPNYNTATWNQIVAWTNLPVVIPPLNDVETFASSAADLVSYYSRALRGSFFKSPATLNEFRRILTIADAIWMLPFPLGVTAFAKGGNIDVPGFHAVCIPGAMFFSKRWVFFAFIINWDAPAATDPAVFNAFVIAVRRALQLVKDTLSA